MGKMRMGKKTKTTQSMPAPTQVYVEPEVIEKLIEIETIVEVPVEKIIYQTISGDIDLSHIEVAMDSLAEKVQKNLNNVVLLKNVQNGTNKRIETASIKNIEYIDTTAERLSTSQNDAISGLQVQLENMEKTMQTSQNQMCKRLYIVIAILTIAVILGIAV